jgi:glycerol-3-phosphate dehydrogenase
MVHGGFRYLRNLQLRLTLQSVRERERLLREGRGLVSQLGFLLANYKGDVIPAWVFGAGLAVYDLLALHWGHRRYDAYDMHDLCPPLTTDDLIGGFRYFDAQTDDARLVLRVIQEALEDGGRALNYASVVDLIKTSSGQVCGVLVQDQAPEGRLRQLELRSRVVVNATGAWADCLRGMVGGKPRLRKLAGSHLIFPAYRLPLNRSVSFLHPADGRPVFALPWEGITLIGTTDVDYSAPLQSDIPISEAEVDYLLQAVRFAFAAQELTIEDIQGAYSGVRPVVDTGKSDPSKESREHILWSENGLLTVTGGKLTTFRLMAHDALRRIQAHLPGKPEFDSSQRVLAAPPEGLALPDELAPAQSLRLLGRYGSYTKHLLECSQPGELVSIGSSTSLWAELRWAARSEAVVHLDDLLLRRVRLGLSLPRGGVDCLPAIRAIAQPELGWNDARWDCEAQRYVEMWKRCYYLGDYSP